MSEFYKKRFEIKVTLTDLKTGKEIDYFKDWEEEENYARAYFQHLEDSHKTFDYELQEENYEKKLKCQRMPRIIRSA